MENRELDSLKALGKKTEYPKCSIKNSAISLLERVRETSSVFVTEEESSEIAMDMVVSSDTRTSTPKTTIGYVSTAPSSLLFVPLQDNPTLQKYVSIICLTKEW